MSNKETMQVVDRFIIDPPGVPAINLKNEMARINEVKFDIKAKGFLWNDCFLEAVLQGKRRI
ncbi:MAG: hypothetical protein ACE5I1_19250 [bacterium]